MCDATKESSLTVIGVVFVVVVAAAAAAADDAVRTAVCVTSVGGNSK